MKTPEKHEAAEWGTEPQEISYKGITYSTWRDETAHFTENSAQGYPSRQFSEEESGLMARNKDHNGPETRALVKVLDFLRQSNSSWTAIAFKVKNYVGMGCQRMGTHMNRPHSIPEISFYEKTPDGADYLAPLATYFWYGDNLEEYYRNHDHTAAGALTNTSAAQAFFEEDGPLHSMENLTEAYRSRGWVRGFVKKALNQLQNGNKRVMQVSDHNLDWSSDKSKDEATYEEELATAFAILEIIQGEDEMWIVGYNNPAERGFHGNKTAAAALERSFSAESNAMVLIRVPDEIQEPPSTELATLVDKLIMDEGFGELRRRLHEGKEAMGLKNRFAKLFPGNPAFKQVEKPTSPVAASVQAKRGEVQSLWKRLFG